MLTASQTVTRDSSIYPAGMEEVMRQLLNALVYSVTANGDCGTYIASGATTATVTSQAKTVNTCAYKVDGAIKSKAATDNLWTLTGAVVPISSFNKYLLMLDAAGTASVVACVAASTAAGVTLPSTGIPASKAVIATLTVATNGSTTFTPGTTLLGAAGITATFIDGFDSSLSPVYQIVPR